jgi:hypothetical protein
MAERGSGGGESLSMGFLLREPGERASLLGTLEDMLRKALDMGISLYRGPLGNLEGIRLPGLLREKNSISGFLSWNQRTLRF